MMEMVVTSVAIRRAELH